MSLSACSKRNSVARQSCEISQSCIRTFERSASIEILIGQTGPPSAPSKLRLRRENSIFVGQCLKPACEDESTSRNPRFDDTRQSGVSDNVVELRRRSSVEHSESSDKPLVHTL